MGDGIFATSGLSPLCTWEWTDLIMRSFGRANGKIRYSLIFASIAMTDSLETWILIPGIKIFKWGNIFRRPVRLGNYFVLKYGQEFKLTRHWHIPSHPLSLTMSLFVTPFNAKSERGSHEGVGVPPSPVLASTPTRSVPVRSRLSSRVQRSEEIYRYVVSLPGGCKIQR